MILDKFSLAGRSGIVTGAGSGIGQAIARGLSEAGADVVIAGRNLVKLENTVRECSDTGSRLVPVSVDMKYQESIQSLVDQTVSEFGKIDFLFNNAGTIHREPSEDHSKEGWDKVLQVNLTGPFLLAQAVARVMISKKNNGKIINTSSLIAVFGGDEDSTDETARQCLEMARHRLHELEDSIARTSAAHLSTINQRLERAEQLLETDRTAAAQAILQGVIELYGDKPWAYEAIKRAKDAIQAIGPDPFS